METITQKLPTNWNEREKLRDKGQFWTPNWVAQAMIAYVAKESDLIFDPGTGSGAFFAALLKLKKTEVKFYGTDIDAKVLDDEIYQNSQCQIELRDFIKNPPSQMFKAIIGNPPYIRHHRINEETKIFLKSLCKKITGFTIDGRAGYHIYFLLQALNLLEAGGRLAFIMPADVCEGVSAKKCGVGLPKTFALKLL
jgi:methylase of polypeptide subunit release factors